jgi:hypothetical protein
VDGAVALPHQQGHVRGAALLQDTHLDRYLCTHTAGREAHTPSAWFSASLCGVLVRPHYALTDMGHKNSQFPGPTCDCAQVRPSDTTSARCRPRASTATLPCSSSPCRRICRTSTVQHTSRGSERSSDRGLPVCLQTHRQTGSTQHSQVGGSANNHTQEGQLTAAGGMCTGIQGTAAVASCSEDPHALQCACFPVLASSGLHLPRQHC